MQSLINETLQTKVNFPWGKQEDFHEHRSNGSFKLLAGQNLSFLFCLRFEFMWVKIIKTWHSSHANASHIVLFTGKRNVFCNFLDLLGNGCLHCAKFKGFLVSNCIVPGHITCMLPVSVTLGWFFTPIHGQNFLSVDPWKTWMGVIFRLM